MKYNFNKIFAVVLAVAISFNGTPKIYFHSFSDHKHSPVHEACHHENTRIEVEKESCGFNKLDTPAQYTIYSALRDFSPKHFEIKKYYLTFNFVYFTRNLSQKSPRGPPVS